MTGSKAYADDVLQLVSKQHMLQVAWEQLRSDSDHSNVHSGVDTSLVLKVIASTAQRFPATQAGQLAYDLFEVSLLSLRSC